MYMYMFDLSLRCIRSEVMMIRNEFLGYQVGVTLGLMDSNPLIDMDWTLNALERSAFKAISMSIFEGILRTNEFITYIWLYICVMPLSLRSFSLCGDLSGGAHRASLHSAKGILQVAVELVRRGPRPREHV